MLRRLGATVETEVIRYHNGAPVSERMRVEGYLQRCVFDDSVSLAQMLDDPSLAPYLNGCLIDDEWRFAQTVHLMTVTR